MNSLFCFVFQSSLLGLGATKYSLMWTSSIILLQSVMDSLVISLSMEESVNIALAEDALGTLRNILRPFAKFDPSSDS